MSREVTEVLTGVLNAQTREESDFESFLQVLYRQRYTGVVLMHFKFGEPRVIEVGTAQVRFSSASKRSP